MSKPIMNSDNHIVNNPANLLFFLKDMVKDQTDLIPIDEDSLTVEIRVNKFVDSITVIGGYWLNTIELMKICSKLELYDLSEIVTIQFGYVAGQEQGQSEEVVLYYDVWLRLTKKKKVTLPNYLLPN